MTTSTKLFLVVGHHRSGTSATAGILYHLGVHMGDELIGAFESNMKGHFENASFVRLNDEILLSAGGTWYYPPPRDELLKANPPIQQMKAFVESAKRPAWGLKDPRFVLTYEVWRPFLAAENITYIFVHRPFEASVSSLMSREQKLDKEQATNLLTTYRKRMNDYGIQLECDGNDIIDVNYEELLRDPSFFVHDINHRLEKDDEDNIDVVRSFIDAKLKHF